MCETGAGDPRAPNKDADCGIIDHIPHLVWVAAAEGPVIQVNRRCLDYSGGSREQLLREGWQTILHPDDLPNVLAARDRSLESGASYDYRCRLRRVDGEYRWHIVRAQPVRDPAGRILHWIGTCTDIDDQTRAEEQVRASEARFRALIERSYDGLDLIAADGTIQYASPSVVRIGGRAPEEVVGRQALEWCHPEDLPELLRQFDGFLERRGESVTAQHRYQHRDGSWRWVESTSTNLLGDPNVGGIVCNFRDVTAQKEAEEVLRARESRYRAITEKSFDALALIDRTGKYLHVSPSSQPILGFRPEEMLGQNGFELVHPEDVREVRNLFESLLEAPGRTVTAEYRARHVDGSFRWVRTRATNLLDDPAVGAVVCNFCDITQKKEAEEEARRHREVLQTVFDQIPVMVAFMDPEGRILLVNRHWEEVFGWSQEEARERDILTEMYPDPAQRQQVIDYIHNASPGWADFQTRNREGQVLQTRWTNVLLSDGTNIGFGQDVTQQRRLEEQYRQAQKMEAVGRLAGGVAHDFNNLLTIINGYCDVALATLHDHDRVRPMVAEVKRAGERAASLTAQLLAFSRKSLVQQKVLDMNVVVSDLHKMLRRLIGEDVRLDMELHPTPLNVKADPGQLEQVILNLAVNARDAMPQGGTLTLQTSPVLLGKGYDDDHEEVRPGPYVLLSVTDTGHGMDEQTRAHLFEPFFTTKGVGKGTGLGLATVYGIVKQSGGFIRVASEPGKGARFAIYLPALEQPSTAARHSAERAKLPGGKEVLLVVEDEEGVRGLTSHMLRELGYQVLEAASGAEALQMAQEHRGRLDLLVTDVVMPGMSGARLARKLLALRPETKILYLSGYTDDAVIRHGVLESEAAFLVKPWTTAGLARKIREVLDAAN